MPIALSVHAGARGLVLQRRRFASAFLTSLLGAPSRRDLDRIEAGLAIEIPGIERYAPAEHFFERLAAHVEGHPTDLSSMGSHDLLAWAHAGEYLADAALIARVRTEFTRRLTQPALIEELEAAFGEHPPAEALPLTIGPAYAQALLGQLCQLRNARAEEAFPAWFDALEKVQRMSIERLDPGPALSALPGDAASEIFKGTLRALSEMRELVLPNRGPLPSALLELAAEAAPERAAPHPENRDPRSAPPTAAIRRLEFTGNEAPTMGVGALRALQEKFALLPQNIFVGPTPLLATWARDDRWAEVDEVLNFLPAQGEMSALHPLLVEACRAGHEARVARLLELGVPPDPSGGGAASVLAAALGYDPRRGDPRLDAPSEDVAANIATRLIEAGANVQRGVGAPSPLACAAARGSARLVRLLVDRGARLETSDILGSSPLDITLARGRPGDLSTDATAVALIEVVPLGAVTDDPAQPGAWRGFFDARWTQLHALLERLAQSGEAHLLRRALGREEMRSILLRAPSRPWEPVPLFSQIVSPRQGPPRWQAIRVLIEAGVPVDTPGLDGETALMRAAECGVHEEVAWLLDRGADLTRRDRQQRTVFERLLGTPHAPERHPHPSMLARLTQAAVSRAAGRSDPPR